MIDTIEHVDLLDNNDVEVRLEYISSLNEGWYYGEGSSFERKLLDQFLNKYTDFYREDLLTPNTYPTVDGEVQLEWSNDNCDISLTVDIASLTGDLHILYFENDAEKTEELNLNDKEGWEKLNELIEKNIN